MPDSTTGWFVAADAKPGDGSCEKLFHDPWQAYFVAVRDLNEDGIPDLTTANFNDNTVSRLLGQATQMATMRTALARSMKTTANGPAAGRTAER